MNNTEGYTDIHAHILPGVDDGSSSMEETIRMLKLALTQGIKTIIATPHYFAGGKNTSFEQLYFIRNQVQEEAEKFDKNFKLFLGHELYYSDAIIDALKSREAMTLAESSYVLVEFSVKESYDRIFRGLADLVRAGYNPILAHVERYQCLYKRENLICELIELGSYIQMNGSSLMGGFLNSEANYNRKLLNLGLVHFAASDCHNDSSRTPCIGDAAKFLQKKIDSTVIEKIFINNPQNILSNTYI